MLDGGAGQARRLETVWRGASTTRATCIVAAAASFCQLVDDADLRVIDSVSFEPSPAGLGSRHRDAKACRTRVLLLAAFSRPDAVTTFTDAIRRNSKRKPQRQTSSQGRDVLLIETCRTAFTKDRQCKSGVTPAEKWMVEALHR